MKNNANKRDRVACSIGEQGVELFFSEEPAEINQAKNLCKSCPQLFVCLEGALLRKEPCGVWGGQLFLRGKIVSHKRKRGRPVKKSAPKISLPINLPEHIQKLIA